MVIASGVARRAHICDHDGHPSLVGVEIAVATLHSGIVPGKRCLRFLCEQIWATNVLQSRGSQDLPGCQAGTRSQSTPCQPGQLSLSFGKSLGVIMQEWHANSCSNMDHPYGCFVNSQDVMKLVVQQCKTGLQLPSHTLGLAALDGLLSPASLGRARLGKGVGGSECTHRPVGPLGLVKLIISASALHPSAFCITVLANAHCLAAHQNGSEWFAWNIPGCMHELA